MEEQRWRKKIVKSAMEDEGVGRCPCLAGKQAAPGPTAVVRRL